MAEDKKAAPKRKICDNCGSRRTLPFYYDPRDPPLSEDACLCKDCRIAALIEVRDEAGALAADYEEELEKLGWKP